MERDEVKQEERQDSRETSTIGTTTTTMITTADSHGSLERLTSTSLREQAAGKSTIDSSPQAEISFSFSSSTSSYPCATEQDKTVREERHRVIATTTATKVRATVPSIYDNMPHLLPEAELTLPPRPPINREMSATPSSQQNIPPQLSTSTTSETSSEDFQPLAGRQALHDYLMESQSEPVGFSKSNAPLDTSDTGYSSRSSLKQQRQVQDNAVRQEQLHQLVHPRVIITTGTKVTTTMATCDRPQQVANIQSTSEPAVSEEMMAVPSYSYTSRPQEISQEISQQLVSESSWSAQQLVPESSSSALSNSQPSPQHTSQTQEQDEAVQQEKHHYREESTTSTESTRKPPKRKVNDPKWLVKCADIFNRMASTSCLSKEGNISPEEVSSERCSGLSDYNTESDISCQSSERIWMALKNLENIHCRTKSSFSPLHQPLIRQQFVTQQEQQNNDIATITTTLSHVDSGLCANDESSQREAKIPSELAELEKTSKEPVSSFTEAPKKQTSIQKTSDVKLQKDTKNKLINSLPSVSSSYNARYKSKKPGYFFKLSAAGHITLSTSSSEIITHNVLEDIEEDTQEDIQEDMESPEVVISKGVKTAEFRQKYHKSDKPCLLCNELKHIAFRVNDKIMLLSLQKFRDTKMAKKKKRII